MIFKKSYFCRISKFIIFLYKCKFLIHIEIKIEVKTIIFHLFICYWGIKPFLGLQFGNNS